MSSKVRGARRFILPIAAAISAAAAQAQNRAELPPGAVVQPLDSGPGAELRRNLTTLADNPRSMAALLGAGQATLAMGDPEAAYSFFERANAVEPASARAKAGMASALLQLERAQEALPLFAEAVRLGAPAAEIAGDRGLAHDLVGEQSQAQADYRLALGQADDPEIRRRLALSLAISGRREEALRTIDGQLRAQDRAGWRTQAFVLALTGDSHGAERTARSAMPPAAADEMAPFLRRLAGLGPAQKARAVHLGHFPSQGQASAPMAMAEAQPPPRQAVAPAPRDVAPAPELPRPGFTYNENRVAGPIPRPSGDLAPPVERPRPAPPPEPEPEPEPEPQSPPAETPAASPAETAPASVMGDAATAGFSLAPGGAPPAPVASTAAPPAAAPPPPAPPEPQPTAPARSRLGDLAALVEALPADEDRRPAARPAAAGPRPAAAAARQNPSRHWVQLAHAARPGPLAGEFAEVRAKAATLLGNRAPYTTLANRTNLLLVGPFDTRAMAQALVRRLTALDVAALVWTSPAGQEIERLRIPNAATSTRTSRADASERAPARAARGRSQPKPRPAARRSRARD